MNWPSERQFFAFAAGVVLVLLLLTDCASPPKRLTHSQPFLVCREACMDAGAADAVIVENAAGMACVCVKKPEGI